MSSPIELVSESAAAAAVPTPWHRTVYTTGETKESAFGLFARRVADVALGVQIEALNTSIQAFTQGVKVAASATGAAARAIPRQVPGATLVADIAARVGSRAQKVAHDAKALVRENSAATSDTSGAGAAGKLAADMLMGPATSVAALPVTTAVDVVEAVASTPAGKTTGSATASLLNAVLDLFSVSGSSTTLDTMRIRETWLAMTTGPGKSALGDVINLSTGFFRVLLGDHAVAG